MIERGVILDIWAGRARVAMRPASTAACRSCDACDSSGEGIAEPDGGERVLEAPAIPGLEPGARVVVEIEDHAALGPVFVVFLMPVAALIAGAILGGRVPAWAGREGWSTTLFSLLGAAAFLGAALVAVRRYDRAYREPGAGARILRIEG